MDYEQEKQLEESLQDNEYALAWADADRKMCKVIRRCVYSRLRLIWMLLYRVLPLDY